MPHVQVHVRSVLLPCWRIHLSALAYRHMPGLIWYAMRNEAHPCHNSNMLLKVLIVRSTTQKDKAFPNAPLMVYAVEDRPRNSEMCYKLYLDGTDRMKLVAIEGIVAHGPGGNKRAYLVF